MIPDERTAVWDLISDSLLKGIPAAVLCVVESKGSSPGRQGFKMAVTANGRFRGTIGGGIMEHKLVEMTKLHLKKESPSGKLFRQLHDKSSSEQSGMICSGEQTIFFYPVQLKDLASIEAMNHSVRQFKNGSLTLNPSGVFFSEETPEFDFFFRSAGEEFVYIEKTGFRNILHVIGGGHCSLALCKIMRELDFFIRVYDDRKDLVTMLQNDYAHEKFELQDYSELKRTIQGGSSDYAVIMTFGYRTDDVAFRALIHKTFRYLGLLGSKKKIDKMFADYRKETISEDLLSRIFAPVGLPIKSETTAEIAVSIAAQIIAEKNKI
jgi:xanthine dehydrogenase accessory factor